MKHFMIMVVLAGTLVTAGCGEELPTSSDGSLIPLEPRTVEVQFPYASFVDDIHVLGGYGSTSDLQVGHLANDFAGSLTARSLIRIGAFPGSVTVRDTLGVARADTALTFPSGILVLRFDTLSLRGAETISVSAGAIETPWHPRSATWDLAIDTIGNRTPWLAPGADPVRFIATATWDPADGDSMMIPIDSATIAEWRDRENPARGARLSMESPGARVRVRTASLRLEARASVQPDSLVATSAAAERISFVYSGTPDPAPGEIRVGGAPAWRTFLQITLPETLEGPPEVCAVVGCPLTLTPESVIFASLVLRSTPTNPAFAPRDTLLLDMRPVLDPARLAKSPLGNPFAPFGQPLLPSYFDGGESARVELPMTGFIRDIIRGTTRSGQPATPMLTILSVTEPTSLDFVTFAGPGVEGAPFLRIIFTLTDGVSLP